MTGTRLRGGAMLALVTASFHQPARAQAPGGDARRDQQLSKIVTVIVVVDALAERCNTLEPDSRPTREAALKKWRTDNSIDALQAVLAPLLSRTPESAAKVAALRNPAAKHAAKLMDDKPGICEAFAVELRDKDLAIADKVAEILPALTQVAGNRAPAATSPSSKPDSKPATVYTILQLSTLAEAAMSSLAAPEGASESKIRDAKAEVGEAALVKLDIIGVRARVVDRDHLEDWRGEYQSTYRVRCNAFVDKVAEERVKALQGTEAVIGGWVSDLHLSSGGGGSITFKKCGFLDDRQLITSDLPENGGLKIRPPSAEEAHAGPGKGIQLRDVEDVVYILDRRTSFGAFGGFSMDRNEETYVLLKDGTAYRHHWRFPFMDLNVDVVKRRDAPNWFRWQQNGKDLLLTTTGGAYAGQTTTLSGYVALTPFPPGTRLDKAFQFMHVSASGVRQDRDYVFHRDGTVELYRSSLFAGQTFGGGANISATGPGVAYHGGGPNGSMLAIGPSTERRVRYQIDGYVLELTADNGAVERHFIARFGDDTADNPKTLYLDGLLLWDRDKKDDPGKE
jgi:hypothetical protein